MLELTDTTIRFGGFEIEQIVADTPGETPAEIMRNAERIILARAAQDAKERAAASDNGLILDAPIIPAPRDYIGKVEAALPPPVGARADYARYWRERGMADAMRGMRIRPKEMTGATPANSPIAVEYRRRYWAVLNIVAEVAGGMDARTCIDDAAGAIRKGLQDRAAELKAIIAGA